LIEDCIRPGDSLTGLVCGGAHGIYEVLTDAGELRCTLRGKLRRRPAVSPPGRRHNLGRQAPSWGRARPVSVPETIDPDWLCVSVGDRVGVTYLHPGSGIIEAVLPRRNKVARSAAGSRAEQIILANLDQMVLVFAVRDPEPHMGMIDRFLAMAEAAGIRAALCFNKVDLNRPPDVTEMAALYRRLGYPVLWTSTRTAAGLTELRDVLRNRVTLLAGPSGVGKSSLLNAIEPGAGQRIAAISAATGKGKHTTTGVRLFPFSFGGWIADSAGIRELALWNVAEDDLPLCFVEFRPYLGHCVYENCAHLGEAGCAILEAVASGAIDARRYRSYERLRAPDEPV
jgi:ribosome biogenesis GTPase